MQIIFLTGTALFFLGEAVLSLLTIGDVVAVIPLLFWSGLFGWWTAHSIRQQHKLEAA